MGNFRRRPISNFFILPRVQRRFILKAVAFATLVAMASTLAILFVYHWKYHTGYFYFMPLSLDENLVRESIWSLVLPSFILAEILSVMIALVLSLAASRSISVPIYKLQQWADQVQEEGLSRELMFRKEDKLEDLAGSCNAMLGNIRAAISDIKNVLKDKDNIDADRLEKAIQLLEKLD